MWKQGGGESSARGVGSGGSIGGFRSEVVEAGVQRGIRSKVVEAEVQRGISIRGFGGGGSEVVEAGVGLFDQIRGGSLQLS